MQPSVAAVVGPLDMEDAMAIKAVLFDLDGTLVDSNDAHVRVWSEVFRGEGHDIPDAVIAGQIGKGGDLLVPALLPDLPEDRCEAMGKAHGRIYGERFLDGIVAFPGAAELVKRVAGAGQRAVLASSAKQSELDHYIGLLGIADDLAAVTSADEVEHSKPEPDIFAAALAKVAPITAAEAMMIGDTPYDAIGAARVGIATIGLRSGGFPDEVLREAGVVALYDDVAALLADYDRSPLAPPSSRNRNFLVHGGADAA